MKFLLFTILVFLFTSSTIASNYNREIPNGNQVNQIKSAVPQEPFPLNESNYYCNKVETRIKGEENIDCGASDVTICRFRNRMSTLSFNVNNQKYYLNLTPKEISHVNNQNVESYICEDQNGKLYACSMVFEDSALVMVNLGGGGKFINLSEFNNQYVFTEYGENKLDKKTSIKNNIVLSQTKSEKPFIDMKIRVNDKYGHAQIFEESRRFVLTFDQKTVVYQITTGFTMTHLPDNLCFSDFGIMDDLGNRLGVRVLLDVNGDKAIWIKTILGEILGNDFFEVY